MRTIGDIHPELHDYARELVAAGFTVYAPGARWAYLIYRTPTAREFGMVQRSEFDGWGHSMPITPSRANGSSAWVGGEHVDPFTIDAAYHTAQEWNECPACTPTRQRNARPWSAQDDRILYLEPTLTA